MLPSSSLPSLASARGRRHRSGSTREALRVAAVSRHPAGSAACSVLPTCLVYAEMRAFCSGGRAHLQEKCTPPLHTPLCACRQADTYICTQQGPVAGGCSAHLPATPTCGICTLPALSGLLEGGMFWRTNRGSWRRQTKQPPPRCAHVNRHGKASYIGRRRRREERAEPTDFWSGAGRNGRSPASKTRELSRGPPPHCP